MKLHGALTIFVMVPPTLTTANNERTLDVELKGDFIKPLMNNGNTIKPVKNNMNNVYNVCVEQRNTAPAGTNIATTMTDPLATLLPFFIAVYFIMGFIIYTYRDLDFNNRQFTAMLS